MGGRGASSTLNISGKEAKIREVIMSGATNTDAQGMVGAYAMMNNLSSKEEDEMLDRIEKVKSFVANTGEEVGFDMNKFDSKTIQNKIKNFAKKNNFPVNFIKQAVYEEVTTLPF